MAKRGAPFGKNKNKDQYDKKLKGEMIVDEVVADLTNGVSRRDIRIKLQDGMYTPQEGVGISDRVAQEYVKRAYDAIAYNRQETLEEARDVLWSRYSELYRSCIESDFNLMVARQCLKDMAQIFGLEKDKVATLEKPDDNVIKITFGFSKSDDNEEDNDE